MPLGMDAHNEGTGPEKRNVRKKDSRVFRSDGENLGDRLDQRQAMCSVFPKLSCF